jgi:hypothetical protein
MPTGPISPVSVSMRYSKAIHLTPTSMPQAHAKHIKHPLPFLWRIIFWALLCAWPTAWTLLLLGMLASLGFGIISIFADSLWGFCLFMTNDIGWYGLLLGSPIGLIIYYVWLGQKPPTRIPATRANRFSAVMFGAIIGLVAATSTFVLSLNYEQRQACLGQAR